MNHATNAAYPAILVAAGSSRRMGFDKLTARLGSSTVIARSLNALIASPSVSSVVVVGPARLATLLDLAHLPKPVRITEGGANRQDSVAAGIGALETDEGIVAIHDGARPLVSTEDVSRVMAQAARCGAASLARRVTETLKRANDERVCTEAVDRTNLWTMETPQAFDIKWIRAALAKAKAAGLILTDEVSAAQFAGYEVTLVESTHPNPKITVPADLPLAEALLAP